MTSVAGDDYGEQLRALLQGCAAARSAAVSREMAEDAVSNEDSARGRLSTWERRKTKAPSCCSTLLLRQ